MATTTTFVWVAAGTAGCTQDIDLLSVRRDGGALDGRASGDARDAGGGPDVDPSVCVGGLGTPIRFPTSTGSACTSTLAVRGHRYGLCTCDALDLTSTLRADSINSNANATTVLAGAAAVGTNGPLSLSSSAADLRTDGALVVASGIATAGHIEVGRTLRVLGSTIILGTDVHVAGDAFMGAAISGTLRVDGLLHMPAGVGMDPMLIPESSIRREPVTVTPPCDCSTAFVDLTAAVADAVAHNDNAIVGLDPDAFRNVPPTDGIGVTCGTYLLSSINASDLLIVAVRARAAIVVTGDLILRGGMAVLLDPGAELDLLIGGRLVASGANPIASTSPARFRIWIAVTQSVVLDDALSVGAQLHAPRAAVVASTGLQISGGLLAKSISAGGPLEVHLDQAVFSSGMPCGEPTATPVQ